MQPFANTNAAASCRNTNDYCFLWAGRLRLSCTQEKERARVSFFHLYFVSFSGPQRSSVNHARVRGLYFWLYKSFARLENSAGDAVLFVAHASQGRLNDVIIVFVFDCCCCCCRGISLNELRKFIYAIILLSAGSVYRYTSAHHCAPKNTTFCVDFQLWSNLFHNEICFTHGNKIPPAARSTTENQCRCENGSTKFSLLIKISGGIQN